MILQPNEEIKDIEGWENIYAITSLGRCWYYLKNKWKEATLNNTSYLALYKVGDKRGTQNLSLARVVAMHFLPNPHGYRYVKHKDGNTRNNKLYNLEWSKTNPGRVFCDRVR